MQKLNNWQYGLGIGLVALSAMLYLLHFLVFRDLHHILIYLIGDLAFLPIDVLLVTIIIHQLLDVREKNERMEKLNMVIGVFFSEAGTELLARFAKLDKKISQLQKKLVFSNDCTDKEFEIAGKEIKKHQYQIEISTGDLIELKAFLEIKRDFLLRLLENPNLLEHETFTDLLRAVFHFLEELTSRKTFDGIPAADQKHILGDIQRGYELLIFEWVNYMKHLKTSYPFLFSLALRTNPFDDNASVVIS